MHTHDDDETCALCPTHVDLAAMRERNLAAAMKRREKMLTLIKADPGAYVYVIEGRAPGEQDIVMQVASTIEKAREWCKKRPTSEYQGELQYHIVVHRVDTDNDDKASGTVSLSIYGMVEGHKLPVDIIAELP